ncbi:MAG: hypothetical protein KAU36_01475 [candidate division Zixibacteria bacterium]|nr:hypothetical protein [candidate division Zixibacteria bacterium]
MTKNSDANINFVGRTIRTTGIVLLVFLPFGFYYLGTFPALAIFSGGVWGIINLIFLSAMVRAAVRPDGADTRRVASVGLIKFPLLYLAGYFLLKVPQFDALFLLIGFSSLIAIMVLKSLGRLLLGLDIGENGEHMQKAI